MICQTALSLLPLTYKQMMPKFLRRPQICITLHQWLTPINSDMNNLCNWCKVNKLQCHPSKTKLMIIKSAYNLNNKTLCQPLNILVDNNKVSQVNSHTCLGRGSYWWKNITLLINISKKVRAGIGVIKRVRPIEWPMERASVFSPHIAITRSCMRTFPSLNGLRKQCELDIMSSY